MASNIFLRGQRYWWRWRPGRWAGRFAYFSNHPTSIRISLRTGCAMLAEQRRIRVEAFMDGLHAMRSFQMGAEDQAQFFKSFAEDALDRIIGDRLSLQSPFHDRINMAHARLCTLYAQYGPFGEGKGLNDVQVLEILSTNGCTTEEILDVLITRDTYANRPPVSDGKIVVHLEAIGLPATRYLLDRARQIALAAMTKACVDATDRFSDQPVQLKLPPPDAMAFFAPPKAPPAPTSEPASAPASVTAPVHDPIPTPDPVPPTEPEPRPLAMQPDTIPATPVNPSGVPHDAPFSAIVQKVITMKKGQGLWNAKRINEVRASANIFIYANGDINFSHVSQQHMHQTLSLMTKLPAKYNHYMVEGRGGFAAALASVAPLGNPGDETDVQRQAREAKIGLHAVTRNKHFTWLKAIIDGAVAAGHPKPEINYRDLRLTKKQVKRTDPRKQNEKRPKWTLPTYRTLTSGPVHTGCASIHRRFEKGDQIIHDGVYWAVLINLNICGRSSEGAGLATEDVIDDAPVPYFHVRHNALRRLKVDEGERKIPIHPKLIELGLLDYVRKIRSLGHHALFPEWVHPGGKLDFAWMMRHKFMDPARTKLFPNGTGLVLHGKDVDSHSLRGTGRTALRAHGVNDSTRDYMSGHVNGSIGVDIYETPEGPELLIKAIEGLDPFFEHLRHAPLNCRPQDQLMFGATRGRPSGKTSA